VPRAARELKPICARIAQNGGAPFLALAGVHVEVPEQLRLPDIYPDLVHAEDWNAAVRACEPYVSDTAVTAFAHEFCLYGSAAEIVDRLGTVREAGADAVFLQHVGSYDLPRTLLVDVAEHVLSAATAAAVKASAGAPRWVRTLPPRADPMRMPAYMALLFQAISDPLSAGW
jgi:5,10-methylenetetrahydromethanopterin reductase